MHGSHRKAFARHLSVCNVPANRPHNGPQQAWSTQCLDIKPHRAAAPVDATHRCTHCTSTHKLAVLQHLRTADSELLWKRLPDTHGARPRRTIDQALQRGTHSSRLGGCCSHVLLELCAQRIHAAGNHPHFMLQQRHLLCHIMVSRIALALLNDRNRCRMLPGT